MEPNKLTTKSQEAVAAAVQQATAAGNPEVEPAHLLAALLAQADGIAVPLLQAAGVDPEAARRETAALLQRLPSAGGGTAPPRTSRNLLQTLTVAQESAEEHGDEYLSAEHLLVAIATAGGPAADLLRGLGATRRP